MDRRDLKILNYLYDNGVGINVNISPLLLEMFPVVDKFDSWEMQAVIRKVSDLITGMRSSELIECKNINIGGAKTATGYKWVDTVPIIASITSKGIVVVEAENSKSESTKIAESLVDTNESVREVNRATIKNFRFQKRMQWLSFGLAALSAVFIVITTYKGCKDRTEEKLQEQINAIMRIDSTLNRIDSNNRKAVSTPVIVDTVAENTDTGKSEP